MIVHSYKEETVLNFMGMGSERGGKEGEVNHEVFKMRLWILPTKQERIV